MCDITADLICIAIVYYINLCQISSIEKLGIVKQGLAYTTRNFVSDIIVFPDPRNVGVDAEIIVLCAILTAQNQVISISHLEIQYGCLAKQT